MILSDSAVFKYLTRSQNSVMLATYNGGMVRCGRKNDGRVWGRISRIQF